MRRRYFTWPAVIALVALAIIPFAGKSTATNQPLTAVNADLSNEYRVISKYADDLVAYDKQIAELNRRARLVNTDVDPLQTKSDDLKRRLTGVQSSVRDIVRKLKAANEWDDLDTPPERFSNAGFKALFRESSFKQDLEGVSNGLAGHSSEISTPLDNIRKKLTSQHHPSAFAAPAPFTFVSLKCSLLSVKTRIIVKLPSVIPSEEHIRETWAACHPGQPYPF